jgi:hypothetical protein
LREEETALAEHIDRFAGEWRKGASHQRSIPARVSDIEGDQIVRHKGAAPQLSERSVFSEPVDIVMERSGEDRFQIFGGTYLSVGGGHFPMKLVERCLGERIDDRLYTEAAVNFASSAMLPTVTSSTPERRRMRLVAS